ncbi:MAG TPA: hypothetical protein VHZ24_14465 [Pirellulales bacterium]|jgi:hypothetical protein|nr:hypothetical protein [Pirellulales bacterium]
MKSSLKEVRFNRFVIRRSPIDHARSSGTLDIGGNACQSVILFDRAAAAKR